ncbi:MAG: GNAT family N-acetyltransferase [Chloroflexota bacterium]
MQAPYKIKPFSPETWSGFVALFGKHKGVRGGCWCTSNRCSSSQYAKMTRDERKAFQQNLVQQGKGYGLLVYTDEQPIAWCQFGPAAGFPRYDKGRVYSKLIIADDWQPQWRISCLFVDKHRRREGWSTIALRAALAHIQQNGGGVVEAFPFNIPDVKRPSYTGSVKMYQQEGFEVVAAVGKDRLLMRRLLSGSGKIGS